MRLTEIVHQYIEREIQAGDRVVDATAGNGHDTRKLAACVGPSGKVIAMDIQSRALDNTRAALQSAGLLERCELQQGDHATLLQELAEGPAAAIRAVFFNLGYLPGAGHEIRTETKSTSRALASAARVLPPGGFLSVLAYRGHPGGPEEAEAVARRMAAATAAGWTMEKHAPDSVGAQLAPILWIARKPDKKSSDAFDD
ncbi:MAG: class I SAM-dependent methyltransferase [Opitutales bacterium]